MNNLHRQLAISEAAWGEIDQEGAAHLHPLDRWTTRRRRRWTRRKALAAAYAPVTRYVWTPPSKASGPPASGPPDRQLRVPFRGSAEAVDAVDHRWDSDWQPVEDIRCSDRQRPDGTLSSDGLASAGIEDWFLAPALPCQLPQPKSHTSAVAAALKELRLMS